MVIQSAVKILLENGADPNIGDDFVNVHTMAKKLSLNSLQVLYDREEEFSDKLNSRATFKGFTALHYAALTDDIELIKLLLENGADPLLENDLGHRAYEYCDKDETKSLLETYEKEALKKIEEKKRAERRRFPLEERLKQHLIGQDAAIQIVSSIIRRKENGWIDEEHPLVFLFLGSSGIGEYILYLLVYLYVIFKLIVFIKVKRNLQNKSLIICMAIKAKLILFASTCPSIRRSMRWPSLSEHRPATLAIKKEAF